MGIRVGAHVWAEPYQWKQALTRAGAPTRGYPCGCHFIHVSFPFMRIACGCFAVQECWIFFRTTWQIPENVITQMGSLVYRHVFCKICEDKPILDINYRVHEFFEFMVLYEPALVHELSEFMTVHEQPIFMNKVRVHEQNKLLSS